MAKIVVRERLAALNASVALTASALDWEGECDFSHLGTRWETNEQSGWYAGNSTRPFLDSYAGEYYGKSLKFSDWPQSKIWRWLEDCDYWWIKDDGVVVLKTQHPLPIEIEQSVGKTDKRLSRLGMQMPIWGRLKRNEVNLQYLDLGPAATLAHDGCETKLSWKFLRKLLRQASQPFRMKAALGDEEAKLAIEEIYRMARPEPDGKLNMVIVALFEDGQLKGNCLVRDQEEDVIVVRGGAKTEVRMTNGDFVIALKPAKKSELVVDIQNAVMHGHLGFFDWLPDASQKWLDQRLEEIENGTFGRNMLNRALDSGSQGQLEKMAKWFLMRAVASGLNVLWSAWTTKQAVGMTLREITSDYGRRGFPIPSMYRYYVMTDTARGMSVEPGTYEIVGNTMVVNGREALTGDNSFEDIHALNAWMERGGDLDSLQHGIFKTLGGMDQDDQALAIGSFMSRSPTFVGEYWWFKNGPTSEWPLDPALLPERPEIKYTEELQGSQIKSRSAEAGLNACAEIRKGSGALGLTMLATRYGVSLDGHAPAEMPASVEDIIDSTTQHFADMSNVSKWARAFIQRLKREYEIPAEMAVEFARTYGCRVEELDIDHGDHWLNNLIRRLEDAIRVFMAKGEILAGKACPPEQFLTAFAAADASAAKLRQHWGQEWQDAPNLGERDEDGAVVRHFFHDMTVEEAIELADQQRVRQEWFDNVQALTLGFLDLFSEDDRVDVMGATLARIYVKQADSRSAPHDFICWQKEVADLTLAAFKKAGLCWDPVWENGALVWEDVEPTPVREHLPMFYSWAYLVGKEPRECSKAEEAELKAAMDPESVVGWEIEPVTVKALQKGKLVDRYALAHDGKIVGQLPMTYAGSEMATAYRVISAYGHDGALIAVCEAL